MKRHVFPLWLLLVLLAGCQTAGWNPWRVTYNDLELSAGDEVVILQGSLVRSAVAVEDRLLNGWKIAIILTNEGALAFSRVTERAVGKQLSIRTSGKTILSATILAPIPDGRIAVTGYKEEDARAIVAALVKK